MADYESRDDSASLIKERADIVQIIGECVDLKKSGTRFLGRCPFHSEKTPSFTVHPGQQFFHCFGCGEHGDVLSFVMKYHNLDFPAALKELARRYQIALPEKQMSPADEKKRRKQDSMFRLNSRVAEIYQKCLVEAAGSSSARKYLIERGVQPDILKKFGIGYAPAIAASGWDFLVRQLSADELIVAEECGLVMRKEKGGYYDRFRDRVLFPIADLSGRICGFGGRILGDGQPKYMNSPESSIFSKSRLLLGLYQQQDAIRRNKRAIIVEGNFDLISLVAHGCEEVVAPLGTALTREQLHLLKRQASDITLLFDGDAAGIKAAVRAVPLFLAEQIAGKVALLPEGHDPDTFVRKEGRQALVSLLNVAKPLPEFALEYSITQHGLSLDGKNAILADLQELTKAAVHPLQRSVMLAHFGERLGVDPSVLDQHLARPAESVNLVAPKPQSAQPKEDSGSMTAAQRRLLGFMILYPAYFNDLADNGARQCLEGSMGEILFLQMERLVAENAALEPEDVLTALPEGAERAFVAELLKGMNAAGVACTCENPEQEIDDFRIWMKHFLLIESSKKLLHEITQAEAEGDILRSQKLYKQKQKIDQDIEKLR